MRLLILLLPWLELATLIKLGSQTSVLVALLYVFATLALGLFILQRQGLARMFQHLREVQEGRVMGAHLLVDDAAVGLAGLLLMFPGVITDVAGLIVLVGPLRRRLCRFLGGSGPEPYAPGLDPKAGNTIEGSYRRMDD